MKNNVIILFVTTILCLSSLEVFLRAISKPPIHPITTESALWRSDKELGWSARPLADIKFTNGYFLGHVTTDSNGNRKNSVSGTYISGYRNMLFIGDSTTASLEVDDDQTVPALVEKALRKKGLKVNIVNLGVRGYGTDQSVRKALLHATLYPPEQIIYMFTNNDFFDNNIIRQPFRKYGKGVYLTNEHNKFVPYNYPVPEYQSNFYGAVLINNEGLPQIYQGSDLPDEMESDLHWKTRLLISIEDNLHVFRLLQDLTLGSSRPPRKRILMGNLPGRPVNPYLAASNDRANAYDVLLTLYSALSDSGYARKKHKEYYDSQFEFLLNKLREIPTVKKVHLLEFPSDETTNLMKHNMESTNQQLFNKLLSNDTIDSYLNLNQELITQKVNVTSMRCKNDSHFCKEGTQWISKTVLQNLEF